MLQMSHCQRRRMIQGVTMENRGLHLHHHWSQCGRTGKTLSKYDPALDLITVWSRTQQPRPTLITPNRWHLPRSPAQLQHSSSPALHDGREPLFLLVRGELWALLVDLLLLLSILLLGVWPDDYSVSSVTPWWQAKCDILFTPLPPLYSTGGGQSHTCQSSLGLLFSSG